ncbi:methyl-accepting chemotaxis protein [Lysinibacillus antri]|uniref:Methyl-accepting chemotaxis protein n=1 Tax=Lysinibacillus antri TaxID=2498145 RepID=A0A3S0P223_9BACI|nr:methyl-accepting chemotaxis protein [Lysinibacillus antri]RUL47897.1 methyl-accepting chemotaxis protein [Lysinibacillus antri]
MNVLRNLSIGRKVNVLLIMGLAFLILVGIVGFIFTGKMNNYANEMYQDRYLQSQYLNEVQSTNEQTKTIVLEILYGEKSKISSLEEELNNLTKQNNERLALYEQGNLDEFEIGKLEALTQATNKYREARGNAINRAKTEESGAAYRYFMENANSHLEEMTAIITELVDYSMELSAKLDQEITDSYKQASIITVVVIIIAVILLVFVGNVISKLVTKPINEVVELMGKAEKGDLTVRSEYKSKDEVGLIFNSFNAMIAGLREDIKSVYDGSTNLASSSEEISASTEEIASGTQVQARSASDTTEMVREMADAVQAVSRNAEEAAGATENTVNVALQGGEVIRETVKGMEEISEKINELASKSVQIGEIVEVIDDIAEQTNLLALNAAIEAARAGEAGKGFAVVADEVRKLAERSSKATKEISDLIHTIQANTEDSVEAVQIGNERAQNAGHMFQEIIEVIQESAKKVIEIAAASEEQAAQSAQVLVSVENIASITEETAASVQENAATATDLAKMAEHLNEVAAKFKV